MLHAYLYGPPHAIPLCLPACAVWSPPRDCRPRICPRRAMHTDRAVALRDE